MFKPEFLNRLDDLIVFHTLDRPQLIQIVDLEVRKVVARLKDKNINITLDQSAQDFLIEKGYDPSYGARPMRRAVEKYLEDPLAEELLRGNVKTGEQISVQAGNGKLVFVMPDGAENAPPATAK